MQAACGHVPSRYPARGCGWHAERACGVEAVPRRVGRHCRAAQRRQAVLRSGGVSSVGVQPDLYQYGEGRGDERNARRDAGAACGLLREREQDEEESAVGAGVSGDYVVRDGCSCYFYDDIRCAEVCSDVSRHEH
ncbi:hypothetical protein D3C84_845950 [compost metagenome]